MTNTISHAAIAVLMAAASPVFATPASHTAYAAEAVAHAAGVTTATEATAVTRTTSYVTEAAKEAIAADFPNAAGIDWRDGQAPDVYTAYFTVNGVKVTASVDKDGTVLSVLRYYDASRVPNRVRNLLTTQFPDRTIDAVTEYTDNTGDESAPVTFQATMEDASHVYTVMVEGHKAKTTQTMDKQ